MDRQYDTRATLPLFSIRGQTPDGAVRQFVRRLASGSRFRTPAVRLDCGCCWQFGAGGRTHTMKRVAGQTLCIFRRPVYPPAGRIIGG